MSLVALGAASMRWPGLGAWVGTVAVSTEVILDAAGEYVTYIYQASEDMNLSHVGFRNSTATGSPTVDVRIETVDATTGLPTGTLWATDTNIVTGALSANSWNLVALTASATIAAGSIFAVKIAYNSGTTATITRISGYAPALNLPYVVTNTGTPAKATNTTAQTIALGSSATDFYALPNTLPISAASGAVALNNSTGARRGMRFKLPFTVRAIGATWWASTTAGDYKIELYDDAGSSLLATSSTFDGDSSQLSGSKSNNAYFDDPVTVTANTWYRLVVTPTSVTNISMAAVTPAGTDYLEAMPGGANSQLTTYATAGGWVDTATQVSCIDVIFDQIDLGRSIQINNPSLVS